MAALAAVTSEYGCRACCLGRAGWCHFIMITQSLLPGQSRVLSFYYDNAEPVAWAEQGAVISAGCLSRAGCYRFMVSSAFRRWRVGSLDGRWPPSALWYLWLSDVEQPDRWPRRSGLCQLLPLWAHVWLADPRLWVTYCRDFAVLGSMVCEIVDSCRCCRTTTAPETAAGDGRDITPDDCSEALGNRCGGGRSDRNGDVPPALSSDSRMPVVDSVFGPLCSEGHAAARRPGIPVAGPPTLKYGASCPVELNFPKKTFSRIEDKNLIRCTRYDRYLCSVSSAARILSSSYEGCLLFFLIDLAVNHHFAASLLAVFCGD
uniref:Uncharacterized protein n=1 Tax=Glossina austeni TaxID=7395 RepID=A0A1A9V7S6_GLOAU